MDGSLEILAVDHSHPLGVDRLALPVHHVVELQHVFADREVASLDLGLRRFNGRRKQLRLDRGVLIDLKGVHQILDPVAAEETHQVVLQREEEPGFARVALTAGTSAELVVDPAGLVPLGADDKEAPRVAHPLRFVGKLRLVFLEQ